MGLFQLSDRARRQSGLLRRVWLMAVCVVVLGGSAGVVLQSATRADDGASLTINVFTCPAGFDEFEMAAELEIACVLPTDDLLFSLASEMSQVAASTGQGGAPATIVFSGLPAGSYLLTEAIPANLASSFVWDCASSLRSWEDPLFLPYGRPDNSGRIGVSLEPGEEVRCSWYNVLATAPESTPTSALNAIA